MEMNVVTVADELATELRRHASAERAVNEKRYLKSDIEHFGVAVPAIRKVARAFVRTSKELTKSEVFELVSELWERDVYELRKSAVNILAFRTDLIEQDDFGFIEGLLRKSHTWALIDELAMKVVAPALEEMSNAQDIRAKWSIDHDFWVRRTAMLALLPDLRRGLNDWDEFLSYADAMLGEEEFFIRKAIGWVLREVSKHSPDMVFQWMKPRVAIASSVTTREAVKYLPNEHKMALKQIREEAQGKVSK